MPLAIYILTHRVTVVGDDVSKLRQRVIAISCVSHTVIHQCFEEDMIE